MFFASHLAAGLIIGKLTGNYSAALLGSLLIDIDHIVSYAKHGLLFNPKRAWKVMTSHEDTHGTQRHFLHSFFSWAIITAVMALFNYSYAVIFSIGYFVHLIFDAFDSSDFYPLFPLKWNIKGPLQYMSSAEYLFAALLFVIYFLL